MAIRKDPKKTIFAALLANLGVAVAKFIGAALTQSISALAEAVHSAVDCTNQILLLIGARRSQAPASRKHPIGHARESFFWSFIVAVFLFCAGGAVSIYEGIYHLSGERRISSPFLAIVILATCLCFESLSLRTCLRQIRSENPYGSLFRWFRLTKSSELLVIFTEDSSAVVGILIAISCVALSAWTGNPTWDAVGSIAIGSLLIVVALLLAVEIKSLIIGEAADADFQLQISQLLHKLVPGARIHRLVALQIGPREIMLCCSISTDRIKDVAQLCQAWKSLHLQIRNRFSEVKWLFIDPTGKITARVAQGESPEPRINESGVLRSAEP